MTRYEKLNNLYHKWNGVFVMAVSHLLSIGMNVAVAIGDCDIESVEGNGLMTAEFRQDIVRVAKDIAVICNENPIELIMFCAVKDIFDVNHYKEENEIGYGKMIFNPKFGLDRQCICGHSYIRHFDPYNDWNFCGCRCCGCDHFTEV